MLAAIWRARPMRCLSISIATAFAAGGMVPVADAAELIQDGSFADLNGVFVIAESGTRVLQKGSEAIVGWTAVSGTVLWNKAISSIDLFNYTISFCDDAAEVRSNFSG